MRKLKSLKKLKMTEAEKRQLFARVQKSIGKLSGSAEANLRYPVPSPFFRFVFFPHGTFAKAGVLALLVLSLSGATAYASLGSLPGDLLYGVKVNVVEKVSKIAARSPESRAKAETVQIERRIGEFEALAEKGRLTREHTEVIEKHIDQRLKNFDRNVSEIKKERRDREENRTREEKELESRIEKHVEKIKKIREERSEDSRALEAILERSESRREERMQEEDREEWGDFETDILEFQNED